MSKEFDSTKLVTHFCVVMAKLETMTILASNVKHVVIQLTRDIHGVGGMEGTKGFLVNEVEKEKPSNLEAYFDSALKAHYETKKVALETMRRKILVHVGSRTSGGQGRTG